MLGKNLNKQEEFPKISKLKTEMSFMDTASKFQNSSGFSLTKNFVTTIVQEFSLFYLFKFSCY